MPSTRSLSQQPLLRVVKACPTVTRINIGSYSDPHFIMPGDDVFVRSPKDKDVSTPWIMKIKTIHQYQGQKWIVGCWFYSYVDACQLKKLSARNKKLLEHMAGCELLLSDHEDTINANTIDYKATVYKLLDGPGIQTLFNYDDWYYRWQLIVHQDKWQLKDVNITCPCGEPYNPESDLQLWCHHCEQWFHSECTHAFNATNRHDRGFTITGAPAQEDNNEGPVSQEESIPRTSTAIVMESKDQHQTLTLEHFKLLEVSIWRGMGGKETCDLPKWVIPGVQPFLSKTKAQFIEQGELDEEDFKDVWDLLDRHFERRLCGKCSMTI